MKVVPVMRAILALLLLWPLGLVAATQVSPGLGANTLHAQSVAPEPTAPPHDAISADVLARSGLMDRSSLALEQLPGSDAHVHRPAQSTWARDLAVLRASMIAPEERNNHVSFTLLGGFAMLVVLLSLIDAPALRPTRGHRRRL